MGSKIQMSAGAGEPTAVAEIQGLEGAFSFAERLLQRIWLRREFDSLRASTSDGRSVSVKFPGTWNRLGGPDFLNAKIELGGELVQGDVELHLRAADWSAHGHREDPKYARVVLHVVLFPPRGPTLSQSGKEIPVLALLPLLYRSLEEFAEEDAFERLANHPLAAAQEALRVLPRAEQQALLKVSATARWRQKVTYAKKRIALLGWREACHQTALEILGYRFNRSPMLMIASEYPLDRWPAAATGTSLESLYTRYKDRWNHQAVRPANHPRTRLQQYAAWTAAVSDWPAQLSAMVTHIPPYDSLTISTDSGSGSQASALAEAFTTGEFRKAVNLADLVDRLAQEVCGEQVGGTRLLTLIADGFWPLLAAQDETSDVCLNQYWFHGYCGDVPESIRRLLKTLELTKPGTPLCHGLAQGLLGWVWREDQRQQQTTAC